MRFGTPLLINGGLLSGFTWWQDPGYHTTPDYLRFGRSLMNPLFSGFAGFADGIYSTLWGDGLCGGFFELDLSLEPTADDGRLFVGANSYGAHSHRCRRRDHSIHSETIERIVRVTRLLCCHRARPDFPDAKSSLLRGSESLLRIISPYAALFLWGPRLGNTHSRTRAFAICSWCILAHLGDEQFRHLLDCSFGAAAFVCCKSLRSARVRSSRAAAEALKAVEADPSNAATARGFHALSLSELGKDEEAIKEAQRAVELNPADSVAHLDLAVSARRHDSGARDRGSSPRNRARSGEFFRLPIRDELSCRITPLRRSERSWDREWLAISPYDAAAHSALGAAMTENGDLASAAQHFGYVMMLRPEAKQAHAQLRHLLLSLAKQERWVAAIARDRCKCPGLTANAGRTRVASCDVSRFKDARWNRGSSSCRARLRSD